MPKGEGMINERTIQIPSVLSSTQCRQTPTDVISQWSDDVIPLRRIQHEVPESTEIRSLSVDGICLLEIISDCSQICATRQMLRCLFPTYFVTALFSALFVSTCAYFYLQFWTHALPHTEDKRHGCENGEPGCQLKLPFICSCWVFQSHVAHKCSVNSLVQDMRVFRQTGT